MSFTSVSDYKLYIIFSTGKYGHVCYTLQIFSYSGFNVDWQRCDFTLRVAFSEMVTDNVAQRGSTRSESQPKMGCVRADAQIYIVEIKAICVRQSKMGQ